IDGYIRNRYLTKEVLFSCALEMVAFMIHPANQKLFMVDTSPSGRIVMAGMREIRLSDSDLTKIKKVREIILDNANDFKTIPVLANEVKISEQKLKYGFLELFKQTIWDFQNNVRMSKAVWLIQEGKTSFEDISKAVGYHSQSAFYSAFKNWCGVTPGQLKKSLLQHRES
ncbi:MAG: AraC family transcriptional regulator, partial [Lachnospiraceae bacterium]|nr:AraC family transcriptional regulator [Lachnospiraceae bacterium]